MYCLLTYPTLFPLFILHQSPSSLITSTSVFSSSSSNISDDVLLSFRNLKSFVVTVPVVANTVVLKHKNKLKVMPIIITITILFLSFIFHFSFFETVVSIPYFYRKVNFFYGNSKKINHDNYHDLFL